MEKIEVEEFYSDEDLKSYEEWLELVTQLNQEDMDTIEADVKGVSTFEGLLK